MLVLEKNTIIGQWRVAPHIATGQEKHRAYLGRGAYVGFVAPGIAAQVRQAAYG